MKSKADIIKELRYLSKRMISCGVAMDYYGGFAPYIAEHGRQMVGAGKIATEWADGWEAEKSTSGQLPQ